DGGHCCCCIRAAAVRRPRDSCWRTEVLGPPAYCTANGEGRAAMRIAMPTGAASRRGFGVSAMLAALLCVASSAASAQGVEVPPRDVYQDRGRGGQGNKVALCVNGDAMMASFESALARELAC